VIQQGTQEWLQMRLGKVTASRVADVIAKTKSGYSASRENYLSQLICERTSGEVQESFTNAAMQWGTETEPEARASYEFKHGVEVVQVSFVEHPTIKMSGASPDGLVGDSGLVEIKCPNTATHLATVRSGKVPGKYITQMMWQMACTDREWCDFVSYDPRICGELEPLQMFVQRVERDNDLIAEIEIEIAKFLDELDAAVDELRVLAKEAK
jgi:putative phage-type endonuclease